MRGTFHYEQADEILIGMPARALLFYAAPGQEKAATDDAEKGQIHTDQICVNLSFFA
ncbi:MAG: hypothetical protein U0Y68_11440 [Blastocatellia bacterium]